MAKLWVVIKREYLERVRTKWFVFVTIFGPVFFGTIMILPGYLSFRGMKEARANDVRISRLWNGKGNHAIELIIRRSAIPRLPASRYMYAHE